MTTVDPKALGARVAKRRAAMKMSQDALAVRVGMKQQGIASIEYGEVKRPRLLREIARALETTDEWILYGDEVDAPAERTSVPVMGYIGAGAVIETDVEQIPPEGLDTVDLPFAVPNEIIAFQVRGDSMRPVYREGDAILVWKDQRMATDSYVGDEAAVQTERGRRYLKEIQRTGKRGVYNLYSHNASLIENVRVSWVGEIYLIVRASQISRAKQDKSASAKRREKARAKATDGMDELPLKRGVG